MTDPTPLRPAIAAKAPRPPHVIGLADAIREVEKIPELGGLLVAWWEPRGDQRALRWEYQGDPDSVLSLVVRLQHVIVNGEGSHSALPSDSP